MLEELGSEISWFIVFSGYLKAGYEENKDMLFSSLSLPSLC